jgi:hypothetical protein
MIKQHARDKQELELNKVLRSALATPPISNEEILRRQSQQPGHKPRGPKRTKA